MKFSIVAILSTIGVAQAATTCAADNCNRAVLGSFRGDATQASRIADCSSYQAGTSTVVTTTTVVTSTITSTSGTPLTTPGVYSPISPEPVRTVPAYASACSGTVRYSSACSCGGFSRATTTTAVASTTFTTITVTPTPALCGNQGVQVAQYADTQPANSASDDDKVMFEVVKNKQPSSTTVSANIGQATETVGGLIKTFRGYVYANEVGSYKFEIVGRVDDIVRLWVGPLAYSGWTSANSNLYQNYFQGTITSTFTATLTQYAYTPIRVAFKDGVAPGFFNFKITSPSGVVISDSTTSSASPFLVQYSCDDGNQAPAFATYGQET